MARYMTENIKSGLRYCLAFMALGMMFGVSVTSVNAAGIFAPDACDPQYYQSLESKAWLEAQREITQNQNLIFKADSVLEYTCFGNYLSELADHGGSPFGPGKMFTGTDRWGTPPTDMAGSLSNLVGAALTAYDTSNFNHTLLGGRVTAWPPGGAPTSNGGSTSYTPTGTVAAGTYTCDIMDKVWRVAKCMDFIDDPTHDGFFTFAEYAADPNDKRFLPTPCGAKTANFQTAIDTALTDTVTPWQEDPVITYMDLIYPPSGSCNPSGAGGTSSMVKTGLVVHHQVGTTVAYEEFVCVVPGCRFVPNQVSAPTVASNGTCCPYTNTTPGNACNP